MSKAFLRETDQDVPSAPLPTVSLLPPGAKNYLTPTGAQRLRSELARLVDVERPALAAATADDGAKRQLQTLDQRIRYLRESLRTAEIVPPPETPDDVVRFGATVTVREPGGSDERYQLVGVDETDPEHGCVSWTSPLARALMNARRGDRIAFKAPAGTRELEILAVDYERPANG